MISRDELRRARPMADSATIRFVRGEISKAEYERLVTEERRRDRQPPGEQTSKSR